jgi:hypothetical protein
MSTTTHAVLTSYLEFLVREGHLPLDQPRVLIMLCNWADLILTKSAVNSVLDPPDISTRRLGAINTAHHKQPWTNIGYQQYPQLKITPVYGNWE